MRRATKIDILKTFFCALSLPSFPLWNPLVFLQSSLLKEDLILFQADRARPAQLVRTCMMQVYFSSSSGRRKNGGKRKNGRSFVCWFDTLRQKRGRKEGRKEVLFLISSYRAKHLLSFWKLSHRHLASFPMISSAKKEKTKSGFGLLPVCSQQSFFSFALCYLREGKRGTASNSCSRREIERSRGGDREKVAPRRAHS